MRPEDEPRVVEVSLAADTVFAAAGVVLPPDDPREVLAHAERVLVAEGPAGDTVGALPEGSAEDTATGGSVVGMAATVTVDGRPHLEQLAVHPGHGRRGVGGALLEAVCAEAAAAGHTRLTLTTFRDLPWNGPWYADRGFSVLPPAEWGPGLEEVWRAEERAGIRVLPRVVMVRELARPS
ncbi:GNAT family N-acetyltransferase [Nocardiopsis akebiae]|uniref:GNAT family N-acetyltransferase n=1 Tax=Nocardiopsis akebiae TaxID=2831968 RepID=A0ABX8C0S4_9ACTN|nr:GNAT family N-acetyltransferase [Nocardiopsis akebiae]QUX27994.1 GNAT family N-acetyltransferase [Nocardiopsis akebiae]